MYFRTFYSSDILSSYREGFSHVLTGVIHWANYGLVALLLIYVTESGSPYPYHWEGENFSSAPEGVVLDDLSFLRNEDLSFPLWMSVVLWGEKDLD